MNWKHALTGPLGISLAAIVVGGAVVLTAFPNVLSALFSPVPNEAAGEQLKEELLAMHTESTKTFSSRVEGRSPFFVPPAPKPPPLPPPPPPPPQQDKEEEAPKVVIPPKYEGPALVGILGDTAFFAGSPTLDIPTGAEKSGLKVLGIEEDFIVRVAHKGGEYSVALRGDDVLDKMSNKASRGLPPSSLRYLDTPTAAAVAPASISEPAPASGRSGRGGSATRGRGGRDDEAPAPAEPAPRGGRGKEGDDPNASEEPSTIPEPLTKERLDEMTRAQAIEALSEVTKARKNSTIDDETKDRLKKEHDMLLEKVRNTG